MQQVHYDTETTRRILVSFLHVLKNLSEEAFRSWMGQNTVPRLKRFGRLLQTSVNIFGYRGRNFYKISKDQQRKAEDAKRGIEDSIRNQKYRLSAKGKKTPSIEIVDVDAVDGVGGAWDGVGQGALAATLSNDFKDQLGKDLLRGQMAKMTVRTNEQVIKKKKNKKRKERRRKRRDRK